MSQQLRQSVDPVLAAAEAAPLVPLSEDEERMLAAARATEGEPIAHAQLIERLRARADEPG